MHDIFLSYSRRDLAIAENLAESLIANGFSVWWDREIPAGKSFDNVIEKAIDNSRCVIILWSAASIKSQWAKVEAEEGRKRGILVPILIEEVEIPLAFRNIQAANLIGNDNNHANPDFVRLVKDIQLIIPIGALTKGSNKPSTTVFETTTPINTKNLDNDAKVEEIIELAEIDIDIIENGEANIKKVNKLFRLKLTWKITAISILLLSFTIFIVLLFIFQTLKKNEFNDSAERFINTELHKVLDSTSVIDATYNYGSGEDSKISLYISGGDQLSNQDLEFLKYGMIKNGPLQYTQLIVNRTNEKPTSPIWSSKYTLGKLILIWGTLVLCFSIYIIRLKLKAKKNNNA